MVHIMTFCFATCTVLFSLSVTYSQLVPTPRPCVDVASVNCALPGMCTDATFASLLCPVSCGHCTDLVPDCNKSDSIYCATHENVCQDLELAVLMCPVSCGFCPDLAPATTSSTPPESTTEWPFKCPVCRDAIHTDDCLAVSETCPKNHVCKGTIDDWKLTMMCASPLICGFEELQGSRNCTSGHAFGPHEHCTFCCHNGGSECVDDLKHVQTGLDSVPLVLHCPTCTNETSPSTCAHRIVPCTPEQNVCQIRHEFGQFTAGCAKVDECQKEEDDPSCNPDRGECTKCCLTTDCMTKALGSIVDTVSPGTTGASPVCVDADYYPCNQAKDVVCEDEYKAVNVCPVTCNKCDQLLQLQTTTTMTT